MGYIGSMTTKHNNGAAQRAVALLRERPELAALVLQAAEPEPETVCTPQACFEVVFPLLAGRATEGLAVVALNRRNRVIGREVLTTGSDSYTVVDPRQVLRWALLQGRSGAASIILAHNHPSGDESPSDQDREVTRRMAVAGRAVGIRLLDHLIVVDSGRFTSLAERGECSF